MKRVAVVINTQYGQTAKIANCIADHVRRCGHDVVLYELKTKQDAARLHPSGWEGAIVGAPVYAGAFSRVLCDWTKVNAPTLNAIPSAFFSVSLNAADARPQARIEDARLLQSFADRTGLRALLSASLIGAIRYREYGLLKRWILKRICGAAGGPTDTSRDHELTDWQAVKAFAEEFARLLDPESIAPDRPSLKVGAREIA